MQTAVPLLRRLTVWQGVVLLFGAALLLGWLYFTPPGLLGKADAFGYAVCHRIDSHSFHIGERALPLCARCSGMYLGALLGLLFQLPAGRAGGWPARKFIVLLGIWFAAFAADGLNSFIGLVPFATGLYEPSNTLRLITGTGAGLGIAALLYPIVNQTLFPDAQNRPALASWRQMGVLVVLAAALDGLILTEFVPVLYPLALLSAATVLLVLGLCYTLLWMIVFKREGAFPTLRQAWFPAAAGLTTALLQVALIDLGRYMWTGTWGGFPL